MSLRLFLNLIVRQTRFVWRPKLNCGTVAFFQLVQFIFTLPLSNETNLLNKKFTSLPVVVLQQKAFNTGTLSVTQNDRLLCCLFQKCQRIEPSMNSDRGKVVFEELFWLYLPRMPCAIVHFLPPASSRLLGIKSKHTRVHINQAETLVFSLSRVYFFGLHQSPNLDSHLPRTGPDFPGKIIRV